MIIAGTGHRPGRCGASEQQLRMFLIRDLDNRDVDLVISGGALGYDQALAYAARHLHVPYNIYQPFPTAAVGKFWSEEQKDDYFSLLAGANEVVTTAEEYSNKAYVIRDKAMVDACDQVLGLWDGRHHGGTYITWTYGQRKRKSMVNLWNKWQAYLIS
jgi:uncharacterized phage-like protein YoqJ